MAQTEMDAAAEAAMEDFKKRFNEADAHQFALWWKDHYMKAGHRRLGRGLVAVAKGFES